MSSEAGDHAARALALLASDGVLLLTDAQLPSAAALCAGAPVRGSWWGHPAGHLIYAVAGTLEAHPDVTCAPLLSGKVTYVYRTLWPALLGVATAHEAWQFARLAPLARLVFDAVTRDGILATHDAAELDRYGRKALGQAAREIEAALLARGESVHTATGAHAKRLEAWPRWSARVHCASPLPVLQARQTLEARVAALNSAHHARARLPWQAHAESGPSA
ncbi:MAG: hypothetical protein ACHQ4H_02145 [Ktedonobacterales bacterium]